MANHWLFLSDPEDFHLDEVFKAKKTMWDGVFGTAAQHNLAEIKKGDRIIGYHTAPDKFCYAVLEVASDAYQNPELKDKNWVVDIRGVEKFKRPVPLAEMKSSARLKGMKLFKLFRPIAVSPLTAAEFNELRRLGGL